MGRILALKKCFSIPWILASDKLLKSIYPQEPSEQNPSFIAREVPSNVIQMIEDIEMSYDDMNRMESAMKSEE